MTFDEHWRRLLAANPALAQPDSRLTLTVAAFRRSLEIAHERGQDEGRGTAMFDALFGKRE